MLILVTQLTQSNLQQHNKVNPFYPQLFATRHFSPFFDVFPPSTPFFLNPIRPLLRQISSKKGLPEAFYSLYKPFFTFKVILYAFFRSALSVPGLSQIRPFQDPFYQPLLILAIDYLILLKRGTFPLMWSLQAHS